MKAIKLIIISIYLFGVISCDKKDNSSELDKVVLSKIDYQGCFIKNPEEATKSVTTGTDTVFYSVYNDTLTLSVIKFYNCCGLLKDSVIIGNDNVKIYISDICVDNCLCYCGCNFVFVFYFTDFWHKNIDFYIYLKGLDESNYELWKETKFIDGLD